MEKEPNGFSPLRFQQYAQDLSKAVYELSRDMKFRITEPTYFLHQERKPGEILENPVGPYRYRPEAGKLDRTAQFEEMTGQMPEDEHVTALPTISLDPERPMSITGLQSGAFKAMLADMRKEIAEAQNSGVADVKAAVVEAKTEITTAVSSVKAKVKSEVADALQEFATFTNGAPE